MLRDLLEIDRGILRSVVWDVGAPWLGLGSLADAGSFSTSVGRMKPEARRARSARVSTPNLLKREEMWNFTVRTVIFNFDAISLLARLQSTASNTSRCRALRDVGQAIERPSVSNSSARATRRLTKELSAGTMTWNSVGF